MKKEKEDLGERQIQKSPAEFFAEHQAIAGFDNLGKSLYTSIRELMENSLDACESIAELPTISVKMEEYNQAEFNKIRGIFQHETATSNASAATSSSATPNSSKKKKESRSTKEAYFRIQVTDNGCGMQHEQIPHLLGCVLSGSKYGVRQTRGKFGLGAKMALIWSKKSTGVPIQITTAHRPTPQSHIPAYYSTCTLDMDIAKNEPKIIAHQKHNNSIKQMMGTKLEILIAGNFTTYKARIVQYLRELAIVTPYAELSLDYSCPADPHRDFTIRYDRRSSQMPPPAPSVKYHPASVNPLVLHQLIHQTKTSTVAKFLQQELACVNATMANNICQMGGWDLEMDAREWTDRDLTQLVQILRSMHFKPPDGSSLSPLGEYNLNLGIRKVLEPEYVATARDKVGAYEGHSFLVEAAVSLGGKEAKEGITVTRFANRIPLLMEAGADVATRVAQTKIKWSSYKMDPKRDKIGVFVSIVSTKIPYKGTGKEYIGDDITEISKSVKRALQSCGQQLRTHLQKRNLLRDQQSRQSKLTKYIPDVTRSLLGLLEGMQQRRNQEQRQIDEDSSSPRKRPHLDTGDMAQIQALLNDFREGNINEQLIQSSLQEAVVIQNKVLQEQQQQEERDAQALQAPHGARTPLYLVPLFSQAQGEQEHDSDIVEHALFSFRPMKQQHVVSP